MQILMTMTQLELITKDPWLAEFSSIIQQRFHHFQKRKKILVKRYGSLKQFASGHHYYGLHKHPDGWVFREYAPNANQLFLVGDFNDWQEQEAYALSRLDHGTWEIVMPLSSLKHGDIYKMKVHWEGGSAERLPAYATRVVQDEKTKIFSAQVWFPEKGYQLRTGHQALGKKSPFIYECHIGMAQEEEKVGSYAEFRINILPRIKDLGYNVIQFMAIQEHPYYGSFGYHVSNFFATSSRFGTPEELKELIDAAHDLGISVIMDLVHSHAVKNESEGIGMLDGSGYLYFHDGPRREHPAWDSLCFDYEKEATLLFLLSNCRYWIEEMGFDGYRFDGVTSMIYYNHGLEVAFTSYRDYYDGGQDEDALTYLALANEMIHEVFDGAITVAEEMSGLPGLACDVQEGGSGFDFRLAMGVPDFWIKMIKEQPDENWNVGEMIHQLSDHRIEERTINYAESHDQALVGDKTILFRLLDKEMYWHMKKGSQSLIVDRGIALHKMIRLITASSISGGYLNFMGNEFGHPEWIDFPREGNDWSHKYARRQWSLVDNDQLRFQQLNAFDKELITLLAGEDDFDKAFMGIHSSNEKDQVLVFQRKDLIFAFNFNPSQSFTDYGINVEPGRYKIVLNSDSGKFGGFNRVDENQLYSTLSPGHLEKNHWLRIYLPARTAFVLRKQKSRSVFG